jgi:sugar phosphate isomerase/epimerase
VLKSNDLCLCCGTIETADFSQLVQAAAAGGFRSISIRSQHYQAAREAGLSDRDMRLMLEEHGLVITEFDPLVKWLPKELLGFDVDALRMPYLTATEDTFFRIAEALGGRHINAIQIFGPKLETDVYAEHFARLCDHAAGHGLKVSLEFLPWSPIPDLKRAVQIVSMANRANGGVLLDTWHHFRSGHGAEDLLALRGNVVAAIQMNDATAQPWDDLTKETVHNRLLPGEGAIDLVGVIRALDDIGCDAPVGVEVFSDELNKLSPVQVARRAGDATRAVLEAAKRR